MSWWNAKYKNDHGEYEITFASQKYEKAKAVEKVCCAVIDKKVNSPDDVEIVRHGRWEWRGGIPWCSNCGEMPPGYSYEGDVNTTPYCPNCGAKMDGEA